MGPVKCGKLLKSGVSCPRMAIEGSKFCDTHDASKAAERGRRGGTCRAEKRRAERAAKTAVMNSITLQNAEEMRAALERALSRVEAVGLDPIASAGAVARLVSAALAVNEQLSLELQFAELKKRVDKLNPTSPECEPWH